MVAISASCDGNYMMIYTSSQGIKHDLHRCPLCWQILHPGSDVINRVPCGYRLKVCVFYYPLMSLVIVAMRWVCIQLSRTLMCIVMSTTSSLRVYYDTLHLVEILIIARIFLRTILDPLHHHPCTISPWYIVIDIYPCEFLGNLHKHLAYSWFGNFLCPFAGSRSEIIGSTLRWVDVDRSSIQRLV